MPADMMPTDSSRCCCSGGGGGGGGGGGFRDDREPCRSVVTDATTEMNVRFGLFADDGSGVDGRRRVEGIDDPGCCGDCSSAGRRLSSFAVSLRSPPSTPSSGMNGGGGVEEGNCGGVRNDGGMVVRKSANMTECVAVPSSEHVAEIVGRQGCKIKALRAKTNTYIKTPVRGDDPVFVVTGRREDVASAKREILSAADHFTQIRASRRHLSNVYRPPAAAAATNGNGAVPGGRGPGGGGQVTREIRVPFRVVGLVVGPKGATVKRIQQETQTYIVTPSRDRDPVFEVIGSPENVERAKREIESYINLRTKGELSQTSSSSSSSSPSSSSVNNSGGGGGGGCWWTTPSTNANQNESSVDEGTSKATVDLLNLLLNPHRNGANSSVFTSYNNILNLGMERQLRPAKGSSSSSRPDSGGGGGGAAGGNGEGGSELIVGRTAFSLDATDLIDCRISPSSNDDLLCPPPPPIDNNNRWRSSFGDYDDDDDDVGALTTSPSSLEEEDDEDEEEEQFPIRFPGSAALSCWTQQVLGLLPFDLGAGDRFVGRTGCTYGSSPVQPQRLNETGPPASAAAAAAHEAIIEVCVGSLYPGSLFGSSAAAAAVDLTLVPFLNGNQSIVGSGSASAGNASSTAGGLVDDDASPPPADATRTTDKPIVDFGLLINQALDRKHCAAVRSDGIGHCSSCY